MRYHKLKSVEKKLREAEEARQKIYDAEEFLIGRETETFPRCRGYLTILKFELDELVSHLSDEFDELSG